MATNSLGGFNFISLETELRGGTPPVLQLEAAPVQRAGVDDTGIITKGKKGKPFRMRSVVDVADISAGNALAASYQTALRTGAWVLVFQGINYSTTFATRYFVLSVEQTTVRRLSTSVGGLTPGGLAVVGAVWTLQPVSYP